MTGKWYSIEELVEHSGFSAGMIYDLTHYGALSSPIRGLDPTKRGSKGAYPAVVIAQLDRYKELKLSGMKKADIIATMRLEVENVPVLQG